MKIWKDKQGNKLTYKEFVGKWKKGINEITPLQKIKTQITATRISLLGIFIGLVITTIAYKQLWWVAIILLGALINTGVQYLGLTQQRDSLLKHEEDCEEMSFDDLMGGDEEEVAVSEEEVKEMLDVEMKSEDSLELNEQEVKNGNR